MVVVVAVAVVGTLIATAVVVVVKVVVVVVAAVVAAVISSNTGRIKNQAAITHISHSSILSMFPSSNPHCTITLAAAKFCSQQNVPTLSPTTKY